MLLLCYYIIYTYYKYIIYTLYILITLYTYYKFVKEIWWKQKKNSFFAVKVTQIDQIGVPGDW